MTKQTVLVIAAHPDDEILGCGGTMARLAHEGHDLYIAILGEGITGRYQQRGEADLSLIDTLHSHSREAAALVGAKDLFMIGLPDNTLDSLPLLEVVKIIEGLVERLRPDTIYTHHGGDLNIDHQVVHRAVMTATRPMVGQPVKEIYSFEIPSSTEWTFGQIQPVFSPNVFVNVSDTLGAKIEAMKCYKTEIRPAPHPRSPEALETIAARWGTVCGVSYAEAFMLIRSVRL